MREIAVIHTKKENDISKNILSKIKTDEKITVFCFKDSDFKCSDNVTVVEIPEDLKEKEASLRNFVSKHYINNNFKGFLHVISDGVEILKDTEEFSDKIEEMMTKLRLKSWFNTETDICNYTFKMFNPRIYIDIDKEEAKKVYDKRIYWTSHANTSYVIYDFSKATYEDVRFEDNFTIAMFYIIEFLARRRNTKAQRELNYMNFYPTIREERGVFRLLEEEWPPKKKTEEEVKKEQEIYQKENEIFQNMHVNNAADGNIEQIIEDLYNILTKNT